MPAICIDIDHSQLLTYPKLHPMRYLRRLVKILDDRYPTASITVRVSRCYESVHTHGMLVEEVFDVVAMDEAKDVTLPEFDASNPAASDRYHPATGLGGGSPDENNYIHTEQMMHSFKLLHEDTTRVITMTVLQPLEDWQKWYTVDHGNGNWKVQKTWTVPPTDAELHGHGGDGCDSDDGVGGTATEPVDDTRSQF